MTIRQKILKVFYPGLMIVTRLFGKDRSIGKEKIFLKQESGVFFYSLSAIKNDGAVVLFETLKGRKVLLVNTASGCGYTGQYAELQKLHEQLGEKLIILAFPANDFKEQEKGSDEQIAEFCSLNYGITFSLMKKSVVVKCPEQHPVYQWLTHAEKNGWCSQSPEWNFSKYLVDETGVLTNYFAPSVSPLSKEVTEAILR